MLVLRKGKIFKINNFREKLKETKLKIRRNKRKRCSLYKIETGTSARHEPGMITCWGVVIDVKKLLLKAKI